MSDNPEYDRIMADVKAESAGNVAYNDARNAVIAAARRLRKARVDYFLGCPESLQPYYAALNDALRDLDALENRS